MGRLSVVVISSAALVLGLSLAAGHAAPPPAYSKEHVITIDPTPLAPPTRWYVPGVTPMIWSLDPESTEAFKTTTAKDLVLKPGSYRFGTFTFDFPFEVTLDGVLDYAPSLDQCVSGRGTRRLVVKCSRTQPYSGQPDYWQAERPN
ncbi:hypothetical protein [Candidatus Nitrospira bockiana]